MGRQTATDMARAGASVIIADIDEDAIDATTKFIIDNGGKAAGRCCDVADRRQVDRLVGETLETYGGIHILINNAGVLITGTIEETTDEIIDQTDEQHPTEERGHVDPLSPIISVTRGQRVNPFDEYLDK